MTFVILVRMINGLDIQKLQNINRESLSLNTNILLFELFPLNI